ncbi:MAG: hypothetical protein N3D85_03735 [Candidatus Bathyarchaeota archaeon]|nr:hypothetical protein [Candidatus Bathyarchaeota archaeon]
MNNKGQFSIIAALFVAIILVSSIMVTYSSIRYNSYQSEPQTLSAIDETNLALKQVLSFTVGYYGSVLQVTGNASYARQLANNYLTSGLAYVASIRPEWGASFTVDYLDLKTNWFTNSSFSKGKTTITYALPGLGISGVTYSTSCSLEVNISASTSGQMRLTVYKDENQPLNNLGKQSFKFYRYRYSNLTWELVDPTSTPTSFANGTYLINSPPEINPSSYSVKVTDTRGISVTASSFSHYTASLLFNSTFVEGDYVDSSPPGVGFHSDFTAQQSAPDEVYDVLTEGNVGTTSQNYYPSASVPFGSTTLYSGTLSDLQSDNGVYMKFRSYGVAFEGSATFGYTNSGTTYRSIEDTIRGSIFQAPTGGQAQSISVYLSCNNRKVKAAIYSNTHIFVASTEEKTVTATGQWVTFNFPDPKPVLIANTTYLLVAWSDSGSGNVYMYSSSGSSDQGHRFNKAYGSWPTSSSFSHENTMYSIYCTYTPATAYACAIEFSGWSDTTNWEEILWSIDSSATTDVNVTLQFFNFQTEHYVTTGEGYFTATLNTTDLKINQLIKTNPTQFRDMLGGWKIKLTAAKVTTTQFEVNVDLLTFRPSGAVYELNLEEQWTTLDLTHTTPRPILCIKTGPSTTTDLKVDVWHNGVWHNILTGLASNTWNNVSIAAYLNSPTFTIRFHTLQDKIQNSWQIDSVLIRPESDQTLFTSLDNPAATVAVEVLQNGTIRWLGQDLQLTTEALPIPPVPVRAIHVNQTLRDGRNVEVPFQVEDWASGYTVPLGLTNNVTVFSNRQMIVFLVNTQTTKFTIWWNGSDQATQTPLAFTNTCFNDDPAARILNNGKLRLEFESSGFTITSISGTETIITKLMRINNEEDTTDPELAYTVYNGVIRDIVQGEAEYSNGANNCPDIYSHIVITLPVNATYFTYQLRLIFINSTKNRVLTDFCLVKLFSPSAIDIQTENGTHLNYPHVVNGNGTFVNYNHPTAPFTTHHWSQFTDNLAVTKGAGIMFTRFANQNLYAFDPPYATAITGSLNVSIGSDKTIELSPVTPSLGQVSLFPTHNGYEITWSGAIVLFHEASLPIFQPSGTKTGLWILAEIPPQLTITTSN